METATATKKNLFTANTKVKETTKATPEKLVVKVETLENKIQRFNELKQEIETREGELEMLAGDIKEVGRKQFLLQYFQQKKKPDNFKIADKSGTTVMFIMMDKYTKVEAEKAEMLRPLDGVLEEKTEYKIDPKMVDKYGQVLSDLIINCELIEEADKAQLITGTLTYGVVKGSIDRLLQFKEKFMTAFELMNPICALK